MSTTTDKEGINHSGQPNDESADITQVGIEISNI